MFKKVLAVLAAICILFTVVPCGVFAQNEDLEIEAAKKAITQNKSKVMPVNDMTADSFLRDIKLILPEGSTVELSFSKETDYRIWNATSEKDGSIFANICFTCGPYTRHEMYDFKIPKLSGAAAEANADKENLAKDVAAAKEVFSGKSLDPNVTAEDVLKMVQGAVKNGSTVELTGEFTKVDSTETKKGSVKCVLKLTLNKESRTMTVSNTLRLLDAAGSTESKTEIKFADVNASDWFAAAVSWAVQKGITAGTSATTFAPNDTCTRAQILTFLWRAVGSPKQTGDNPFSDVKSGDYYYDAALWAYDMDMVDGETFEGNTPCTRAATVTYLWKNAGWPDASAPAAFADVSANADYAEAVAWAVANSVTSGTSDTTFSPDDTCTRGQIVTFLNRAIH